MGRPQPDGAPAEARPSLPAAELSPAVAEPEPWRVAMLMARSALGALPVLARQPALWLPAVRAGAGLVPRRWWRRWPPLPLPDREWLAFRWQAAYGGRLEPAPADEVVDWLEWWQAARQAERHRRPRQLLR